MDRDGRGKPPSSEAGSFDLSKMSEAEAAAALAARMARWRDARRRSGKEARDAPARDGADPALGAQAPATVRAPGHASVLPRELDPATVARIDSALRLATPPRLFRSEDDWACRARPRSYGSAFESVLAEGPNTRAVGMAAERPAPPPLRARALPAWDRTAAQQRAVKRVLAARAARALRHMRAAAGAARIDMRAAWRALDAGLDECADQALQRAHTLREAAGRAGRTLASSLAHRFDASLIRARTFGRTAQRAATAASRASRSQVWSVAPTLARCARATGSLIRRSAADRIVIASAAVILVAIAVWVMQGPDTPAPKAASAPEIEKPPARTDAQAMATPSEPPVPSRPHPTEQRHATTAPVPAKLKPLAHAPALAARLKPGAHRPATPATGDPPLAKGPAEAID